MNDILPTYSIFHWVPLLDLKSSAEGRTPVGMFGADDTVADGGKELTAIVEKLPSGRRHRACPQLL